MSFIAFLYKTIYRYRMICLVLLYFFLYEAPPPLWYTTSVTWQVYNMVMDNISKGSCIPFGGGGGETCSIDQKPPLIKSCTARLISICLTIWWALLIYSNVLNLVPNHGTRILYQVCVFRADRKNKMATLASDWLRHFRLLLWNRWTEFNETWQEARSQRPLPSLCFSGRSEKTRWPPWPIRQKGGTLYSGARYVALWASCFRSFHIYLIKLKRIIYNMITVHATYRFLFSL